VEEEMFEKDVIRTKNRQNRGYNEKINQFFQDFTLKQLHKLPEY